MYGVLAAYFFMQFVVGCLLLVYLPGCFETIR